MSKSTKAFGMILIFVNGKHQEERRFLGCHRRTSIDGRPEYVFFTDKKQYIVEYEKADSARAKVDIDYEQNPPVVLDRFERPRLIRWGGKSNASNLYPHSDQVGNHVNVHGPMPIQDAEILAKAKALKPKKRAKGNKPETRDDRKDVIAAAKLAFQLRNSKGYSSYEGACMQAIKDCELQIGWQALMRHVRKLPEYKKKRRK